MTALYGRGLARGTETNRTRYAHRYVRFMYEHRLPPLLPDQYDVLQYTTRLASCKLSPGTINNMLSGAKNWVQEADGDTSAFESKALQRLKRGIARDTTHVIVQAPPIQPPVLAQIIDFLRQLGPASYAPSAALLIAYFTFVRQSNLLTPSPNVWDHPHTLRRRDVSEHRNGLRVLIRSSKTILSPSKSVFLFLPRVPGSPLCPLDAWTRVVTWCPAPPSAPAFMSSPCTPLDQRTLTGILRSTLAALRVPNYTSYTLHSLRRGAAQACQAQGVDTAAIMGHGTWESDAVFSYIPRQAPTAAPVALAEYFGRATGAASP